MPLFELLAREPIQQLANGRDQHLTESPNSFFTFGSDTNQASIPVEDSIRSTINSLRAILSDGSFTDFLAIEGLRSMPRLIRTPTSTLRKQGRRYSASLFEFAIIWAFVSKLAANPRISLRLNRDWPGFMAELKMVYFLVLAKSPFSKSPQ
jgi:hypothetical protein